MVFRTLSPTSSTFSRATRIRVAQSVKFDTLVSKVSTMNGATLQQNSNRESVFTSFWQAQPNGKQKK
ncbi:unnamed protein product [Nippostrongylus brasiliensis]|uniref:Uncharacterized protein n=1 Tax=Nippostrongylus brasiliensis TaxID=27835 RepID=A0A0N4XHN7_NIPBR|nr:unnamed protein product [Nippostrongylus brasiliensis]